MFKPGVLPEIFPGARERKRWVRETRTTRDVVAEAQGQPGYAIAESVVNGDPIEADGIEDGSVETISTADALATMELTYHVTGERRKELVKAISQITGLPATYQNAPTFAFAIGKYIVDKNDTPVGELNAALVEALEEQRFIAE